MDRDGRKREGTCKCPMSSPRPSNPSLSASVDNEVNLVVESESKHIGVFLYLIRKTLMAYSNFLAIWTLFKSRVEKRSVHDREQPGGEN